MKVLVTGATGFLGSRLLEALSYNDEVKSIVATGRTIKSGTTVLHPKIIYHLGSLNDQNFVDTITCNVDIVINAAALSAPWGSPIDFEKANIETQKNLIDACKRFKVQRFIYISSPSIYATGKARHNVCEKDPLPAVFINEYARTKYEAERMLSSSNIPFIALRPRAIIGRGDTVIMPRLIKAFRENKLRIIGNGQNMVDLTSVDNVCDAVTLSLTSTNPLALNQAYNITNGASVELWPLIDYVISSLGYTFVGKKIPFWFVDKFAWILEQKSKWTDMSEPSLTRYSVSTLAHDFTLDISKAKTLLGYVPRISTQEAVEDFIYWYKHE